MLPEDHKRFEEFMKDYKPEPVERRGFLHIGRFDFEFQIDWKFLALTPAVNLNFHGFTFEIEFLFFALYIDYNKYAT